MPKSVCITKYILLIHNTAVSTKYDTFEMKFSVILSNQEVLVISFTLTATVITFYSISKGKNNIPLKVYTNNLLYYLPET